MACKICGKLEKDFDGCTNRDCPVCFWDELVSSDGTLPPEARSRIAMEHHFDLGDAILNDKANLLIARK